MLTGLLHTHSLFRYVVLVLLIIVILTSLTGWLNKKPYSKRDNKLGLFLMISTHLQMLIGLLLYWKSDLVQFNSITMKSDELRYWTVEHISMMMIAVTLITLARATSKKMTDDGARLKRMFIFNAIALIIIVVTILMGGRGLIHPDIF